MTDHDIDALYGPLETALDKHDCFLSDERRENQVASKRMVGGAGMRGERWLKNYKIKTQQPCTFFMAGNCAYHEKCAFSHDPELLRYGNAHAAPGHASRTVPNNPSPPSRRGTKLCRFFLLGQYRAGANYTFVHPPATQAHIRYELPARPVPLAQAVPEVSRRVPAMLGKRKRLPDGNWVDRNVEPRLEY
ncbi:hypothetical protein CC86DRAFT_404563 [Ophiobolus disseminans]|uniref:C3H1-type domain-containing protein n=1 Tax=Ophiobolus disseminans TaxID=1469910 RepID=A0A6A7A681_9PLEO|nr:hypothetical protein CC86DRAFT_404563 [Ophiobolus disseminans]